MLLMEHPAENNILKFRESEEAVEQMGDVAIYHRLCFVGHNKAVLPTPIVPLMIIRFFIRLIIS